MIDRLLISFSGGETSALMTLLLLHKWRGRFNEVVVAFANTGQERDETLEFVDRCDKAFGFNCVWVEAEVHHSQRKGTTHKRVSFATASRLGEPFESVIQKYGIPNHKFPHCTRELKIAPLRSLVASLGWQDFSTAIGIRADEANRKTEKVGMVYPLCDWAPLTKAHVNTFWQAQPFRLNLAGYQGNCKWCWKKTDWKLLAVLDENPEFFDFPERMEAMYGRTGPEFRKGGTSAEYQRVFFRQNRSTADMRALYARGGWKAGVDDSQVYIPGLLSTGDDESCAESCEVEFT